MSLNLLLQDEWVLILRGKIFGFCKLISYTDLARMNWFFNTHLRTFYSLKLSVLTNHSGEIGQMLSSSNVANNLEWKLLSCVRLLVTPWTIQSMEFSRPEYLSRLPFPSLGDHSNPGIEPRSPVLQVDSWADEPPGKPANNVSWINLSFSHLLSVCAVLCLVTQ